MFQIRRTAWRRSLLIAAIFVSAVFAQRVVGDPGHSCLSLSLPLQFHFFLAGMLLTDLYVEPPHWLRLTARAADLLAIVSVALLVIVIHRETRFAWTQPFLLLAFFRGAFTGQWISRIFRFPLLTFFGGMGYTTYLYHVFVIDHLLPFSIRLFPPVHALWFDTAMQIALVTPPVLAICAVLFFAIERPFMILSKNVARRLRASR